MKKTRWSDLDPSKWTKPKKKPDGGSSTTLWKHEFMAETPVDSGLTNRQIMDAIRHTMDLDREELDAACDSLRGGYD